MINYLNTFFQIIPFFGIIAVEMLGSSLQKDFNDLIDRAADRSEVKFDGVQVNNWREIQKEELMTTLSTFPEEIDFNDLLNHLPGNDDDMEEARRQLKKIAAFCDHKNGCIIHLKYTMFLIIVIFSSKGIQIVNQLLNEGGNPTSALALIIVSGLIVLGITYGFYERTTTYFNNRIPLIYWNNDNYYYSIPRTQQILRGGDIRVIIANLIPVIVIVGYDSYFLW